MWLVLREEPITTIDTRRMDSGRNVACRERMRQQHRQTDNQTYSTMKIQRQSKNKQIELPSFPIPAMLSRQMQTISQDSSVMHASALLRNTVLRVYRLISV